MSCSTVRWSGSVRRRAASTLCSSMDAMCSRIANRSNAVPSISEGSWDSFRSPGSPRWTGPCGRHPMHSRAGVPLPGRSVSRYCIKRPACSRSACMTLPPRPRWRWARIGWKHSVKSRRRPTSSRSMPTKWSRARGSTGRCRMIPSQATRVTIEAFSSPMGYGWSSLPSISRLRWRRDRWRPLSRRATRWS